MKALKYLIAGMFFGAILIKSEVASWYRVQEMFRFQSFHMFGIMGSAVILGIIFTLLIKKFRIKDIKGNPIQFYDKDMSIPRYLIGGIIFGLGWALTGACPGPMVALIGQGAWIFAVVILSAVAGTFVYGLVKNKLPH